MALCVLPVQPAWLCLHVLIMAAVHLLRQPCCGSAAFATQANAVPFLVGPENWALTDVIICSNDDRGRVIVYV
jgi:hypothetical protein